MGASPSSTPHVRTLVNKPYKRKPRKALSCEPCRASKLRCDRELPCGTCKNRECEEICTYTRARQAPKVHVIDVGSPAPRATVRSDPRAPENAGDPSISPQEPPATGQTQDSISSWENVLRRPAAESRNSGSSSSMIPCSLLFGPEIPVQQLLGKLPPRPCCDFLVSHYFVHLSPLFHILHGPTFQQQYSEFFRHTSDVSLSWLALLFALCSISLLSLDTSDPTLIELWLGQLGSQDLDTVRLAHELRSAALTSLSQSQFVIHHDLNTLEALLILIYTISHHEGVERGWTFLGMALNIGITLRCNVESKVLAEVERERRRRCWAGILMLHTYQGILFRDIKMAFLLEMKVNFPSDIRESEGPRSFSCTTDQLSGLTLMKFKIRLFRISTNICSHISGSSQTDERLLIHYDSLISEEEKLWDSTFLVDGNPSVLDTSSYVHWCALQTYAHQLYLLIHRPFHNSRSPHFRAASREKCLKSSVALLDIHGKFYEAPRFRFYRWLVHGMTSFQALHAAVALASCLLDVPNSCDSEIYLSAFDTAIFRLETLRNRSLVCSKACPILHHLKSQLSEHFNHLESNPSAEKTPNAWVDSIDWLDPGSSHWLLWDEILGTFNSN